MSYSWDFGDGSFSSLQNPSHTYAAVGQYHAVCTVTDSDGDTATDGGNIDVKEEPIETVRNLVLVDTHSPMTATEGDVVELYTAVLNEGNRAETSQTRYYVDGIELTSCRQGFSDLPPGMSYDNDACAWTAKPGQHLIQMQVDPVYAETSITDNYYAASLFVEALPPVDLFPSVSADADPKQGDAPLDVDFTCRGTGGDAPLSYSW
ncbi:MAG: PKD domain-containing protein, partial [DPANN group archaeon]|nr:PKD domain-containing protein [DPANN group archaeon]